MIKNRLMAIALLAVGVLSIFVEDDCAIFVVSLLPAGALFFAKENLVTFGGDDDEE